MLPIEIAHLKKLLIVTAAYYRQELPDAVLLMHIKDLEDLPFDKVAEALQRLRYEPNRRQCPMPADVRAHIDPGSSDLALANEIAGKITSCMANCGYTNPRRAEEAIGPVGWAVVSLMGGWHHLCTTTLERDMRTFYAQCRDQAKGQLEMRRKGAGHIAAKELPDSATRGQGGLMPVGDIARAFLSSPR